MLKPTHARYALAPDFGREHRTGCCQSTGACGTLGDLAAQEKISPSYLTRVLRLTLLAPDIIDAILGGQLGPDTTLATLMDPFPIDWDLQRQHFCTEA